MAITTEQRERVARARGWEYEPNHGPAGWVRFRGKYGDLDYTFLERCPPYDTDPALNYELEVEAGITTSPSFMRNEWLALAESMGGKIDSSKADNPLTARFLAYLAWMEETK